MTETHVRTPSRCCRPSKSRRACASWARRSRGTTRAQPRCSCASSRGASSSPPISRAPSTCRCASISSASARTARDTESSGVVQITQDLSRPIEHEDVLLVEDIVDTGLTIAHLMRSLAHAVSPRASGCARCSQAGAGARRACRSTTSASPSKTGSSSATGSTSPSATETSRTSASSSDREA